MAKPQISSTQAVTPAAAPTAPARVTPAQRASAVQNVTIEPPADVVEWGNGEPLTAEPDGGASKPRQYATEPAEPKAKPDETPLDEPAPDSDTVVSKLAAEPKETASEKRQRALDSLAAERRSRHLESQLKEAQGKLSASEKLTLGEILKAKGVDKEDLLEKLLTGGDGLDIPAKKLEGTDADVAALKTKLDEVTKKLEAREKAEAERNVQDSIRHVGEMLKDQDDALPLVNSMSGAHELVMNTAFEAWKNAGQEGTARDFVPDAARTVEAHLRERNPKLAARLSAKPKAETPAEAFALKGGPSISRRTSAAPHAKPAPLPLDMAERDAQIKREFGW